jgi:hypothetical protein
MRRSAFASIILFGLVVTEGSTQEKVCCDLLIYEPASGEGVSYAVKRRKDGSAAIAEFNHADGWRLIEGKAARRRLSDWSAMSRKAATTSVLTDARDSDFHIGAWDSDDGDAEEEAGEEDLLVLIHKASAAQAHRFIGEIDGLPQSSVARMKTIVPEQ